MVYLIEIFRYYGYNVSMNHERIHEKETKTGDSLHKRQSEQKGKI